MNERACLILIDGQWFKAILTDGPDPKVRLEPFDIRDTLTK